LLQPVHSADRHRLDLLKRSSANAWRRAQQHLAIERSPAAAQGERLDAPGVRRLAAAASAIGVGRPLQVLVEIGYAGGRCGCRDAASALAVARAVGAGRPGLGLAGLEAFEGMNQSLPAAEAVERVAALLDDVVAAATAIDAEGLFGDDAVVLSAGVASYYDLVAARFAATRLSRPTAVVVRSGCYLTHDAGLYKRQFEEVLNRSPEARAVDGRFQNALEVWAQVISVPEAGRAMLGAGRRDFAMTPARPGR
jgi:D-serine dehydratase